MIYVFNNLYEFIIEVGEAVFLNSMNKMMLTASLNITSMAVQPMLEVYCFTNVKLTVNSVSNSVNCVKITKVFW